MLFRRDPRDGFTTLNAARDAGYHAVFCIPTNLERRRDGTAIMGAGIAQQACTLFPGIDRIYGHHLGGGRNCVRIDDLVMFPTKRAWRDQAHVDLMATSTQQLLDLALREQLDFVLIPPVGCGLGGLDWNRTVRPLLTTILAPIGERVIFVGQARTRR